MKNPRLSQHSTVSRFSRGKSRRSNGFTLVELLVVITIIIIMAALSYGIIGTMRKRSHDAGCVKNLRAWGVAIQLFSQDNGGKVQWRDWYSIGGDRWYESALGGSKDIKGTTMEGTAAYFLQVYRRCPTQKWVKSSGNGPVGYAMVRPDPKESNVQTFNLSHASSPGSLLLMMDANASGFNLNSPKDFTSAVMPLCQGSESRHRNHVNALFADNHVASYTWADIDGDSEEEQAMLTKWFTLKQ